MKNMILSKNTYLCEYVTCNNFDLNMSIYANTKIDYEIIWRSKTSTFRIILNQVWKKYAFT